MQISDPRITYADILIALANVDDNVDPRERELLDGIFANMQIPKETVQKLWLTPRTIDVAEALLRNLDDERFKRCLLKDCYLLAYSDADVVPEESKFIKTMREASGLSEEMADAIEEWVETALNQQQLAVELFE